MPNPQLIEYITQSIAQGASEKDIKAALLGAGWKESDVDEGLLAVFPGSAKKVVGAKSKALIVTMSVLAALLLAGGGFAYWYFVYEPRTQPKTTIQENTSSSLKGTIKITSPQEGAIVKSGESVLVTVEASEGLSLQKASAWIVPNSLSDIPELDEDVPFQVLVKISEDYIGPAILRAVAVDQNGDRLETSIPINISTSVPLQSLQVLPEDIYIRKIGETEHIFVTGIFSDGSTKKLTKSSETIYQSVNHQVVSVNTDGLVQAILPGTTSIHVNYGDISVSIPVTVGITEIKGDLNGDLYVDQGDIDTIIAAINTAATGPDDPRDLNKDGVINDLDVQELKKLMQP